MGKIGNTIRNLRLGVGLSQTQFGRVLWKDTSLAQTSYQNMISKLELGERKLTIEDLFVVSDFFKVPIDVILKGTVDIDIHSGALLLNPKLFDLFEGIKPYFEQLNATLIFDDIVMVKSSCTSLIKGMARFVEKDEFNRLRNTDNNQKYT